MFRSLVSDVTVMTEYSFDDDDLARADRAAGKLTEYFAALAADRRQSPRDDLLSTMIREVDSSDDLSDDDLMAMCTFLFIAGFETTTNSIGKGLWALLHHPDQLKRWRSDPALAETAVQEIIRYDNYVHCANRTALEHVEFCGQRISAGDLVLVFVAAANRDPMAFPDPDSFDVGRDGKSAMSFGIGPHFCLGANLALLELKLFFTQFLARFQVVELGGEPTWHNGLMLRGLKELPLFLNAS
jgi:cytochrome P450